MVKGPPEITSGSDVVSEKVNESVFLVGSMVWGLRGFGFGLCQLCQGWPIKCSIFSPVLARIEMASFPGHLALRKGQGLREPYTFSPPGFLGQDKVMTLLQLFTGPWTPWEGRSDSFAALLASKGQHAVLLDKWMGG